jgi:lipopolysaccharide transport system ATP-binding protein
MLRIGEKDRGDDLWALRDISFKVEQGELLGIIGRNGAGKSTLLKILSRVTAPTSGKIKVKGRIASLLEVGTGFHPDLTGRENIYLNGAILGMTKDEVRRRFDEIVDFAGVEKFIDTPVKRYSSGMYVRMAFAVAAHLDSDILVVDEVLAVGDAAFQKKCLGKMQDVSKDGRTVLFVSHNMSAIAGLTQKCIYMKSGMLSAMGSTEEMIHIYMNEVASNFEQHEGYGDLRQVKRRIPIIDAFGKFTWVRTLDDTLTEKAWFMKGQPFLIEAGFVLSKPARNLQFGFGVKHIQAGVDVFISPSPVYRDQLPAGSYKINMLVDENCLQVGTYAVILKFFCDDVRQDTLGETLFFEIVEDSGIKKQDTFQDRWAFGLIDLKCNWADSMIAAQQE